MNTKQDVGQFPGDNGAKPANTTAIDRPKQKPAMELLKEGFEKWKPTIRAILPKHIDPERVIKIAMNVYMNNPGLLECTPQSMVRATMQAAELGLEPSPQLGEAWFLPFRNKKQVRDGSVFKTVEVPEVQLIPGYVGFIKLAKQSGEVADVYAVIVDESEKHAEFDEHGKLVAGFHVEEGTDRRILHVRRTEGRTGNLHAVYGVVKFRDGTCHFEILDKAEVDAIRKRSKASTEGPWVTDYNAMAKKTAIKQALKTVPKSPEKPRLANAIATDNASEGGAAFTTELASSIDTEGTDVTDSPPTASTSRTDQLSAKLAHDPVTGEVR